MTEKETGISFRSHRFPAEAKIGSSDNWKALKLGHRSGTLRVCQRTMAQWGSAGARSFNETALQVTFLTAELVIGMTNDKPILFFLSLFLKVGL